MKPRALELFAGFGGVGIALESMGYTVAAAVEREAKPAEVYQRNHPGTPVCVASVADVDYTPYYGVDLMHGSPPCQNFSQARSKNLPAHADADVGLEMVRAAAECRPRLITLENVPSYRSSDVFRQICEGFAQLGYVAIVHPATQDHHVYSWDKLGGPQGRRRLMARWVRRDCLDDLPIEGRDLFATHCWGWALEPIARPTSGWYAATKDLDLPIGEFAPWQREAIAKSMWPYLLDVNQSRYLIPRVGARLDRHGAIKWAAKAISPAPTVKALGHCQHWRQFNVVIAGKCYDITPRFLARLQGFPDWFELPPVAYVVGKGIGNAVPPPMYRAIVGPLLGRSTQLEVAA